MAARDEVFDDGERLRRPAFGHGAHDAGEHLGPRDSERGLNVRRLNLPLAETDDLVEGRLRVAHRAFARARNLAQRVWGDFNLLLVGDVSQSVCDLLRRDCAELELLAAREDGFGNLVRVRRRHDEEDARRRLLNRLQKRIEGVS